MSQATEPAAKVVDQTSIHTQFAALQSDRDRLHSQLANLDRARRQEEQTLTTLRQSHARIALELRSVNDTLGGLNDKRLAYQREQQRLNHIFQQEKHELIQLINEMEGMEQNEVHSKRAFVKEMDEINGKMDRTMQAYEKWKMKQSIEIDSVEMVLKERVLPALEWNAGDEMVVSRYRELASVLNARLNELRLALREVEQYRQEQENVEREVGALREEAVEKGGESGQVCKCQLLTCAHGWF